MSSLPISAQPFDPVMTLATLSDYDSDLGDGSEVVTPVAPSGSRYAELVAALQSAEEQMEIEVAAAASADEYVIRTRGASESGIAKLERVEIDGLGWKPEDCCTICLEQMGSCDDGGGRKVIKLECRHVFHESCLISWIQTSNGCPLCRLPISD
ncbi:E3 ubiquitin-protein ligase RING1-like [Linum perenne]